MTQTIPISAALSDHRLFGTTLGNPASWMTWAAVLKATFNETLNPQERGAFEKVAGNRAPPTEKVRELIAIVGRGGGKTRIAAAVAAYVATCIDHSAKLSKGETGVILVLARSQGQARTASNYIEAR